VFVSDLVECVMDALPLTGTYDVCSGTRVSILEQWHAVRDALDLDAEDPLEVPASSDDVRPAVDPSKGLPGWRPIVGLEEGVAEAVAWYQEHGVEQTFTHLAVKA
jgi:nucleoside-diphosphate-sugar epimerase